RHIESPATELRIQGIVPELLTEASGSTTWRTLLTRILNRRLSRRAMLAGSAGGVLSVSLAAIPAACRGKVYPGTTIHGIDLSGNSADESFVQLTHAFSTFEQHAVTFTFEDRSWE